MSITLKAELETWTAALKAYDEQDFVKALDLFSLLYQHIADSSKILTNMGLIYATIGEHEIAVEHFIAATNLDSYLAIAHFQSGVSNFLIERYDLALLNFEDAYLYLRGNEAINYEQIGLKFKLFSAEIMFNKGLTQMNLGYTEQGMADMQEAGRQMVTDEHHVIDEAIRDYGEGYTVFSIPVGVLYRPSENKTKNSKSKDYLGKAKLVAASDFDDAFTEFTGVKKLQQASGENTDNKEESDTEFSAMSRSASVPLPRTESVVERRATLERSMTSLQPGPGVRPDVATILASRQVQSVSNPANVPPRPLASDLSQSNTALGRSNTTRLERGATTSPGVMPLRAKTPHGTAGGVVGVGTGSTSAGEETGAPAGGAPTALRSRPSLRRLQVQGAPQQQVPQASPLPLQPGQHTNSNQSVTSLVLSAAPVPMQGGGHLTQFYDTVVDVYTDNSVLRSAIPRLPASQVQPNVLSSQRQSLATYRLPQPQEQEQQPLPTWTQPQSAPSSVRTSSNTNTRSGSSRVPPRAANADMMNPIPDRGMGTIGAGGGTRRRKPTRRLITRRATIYDGDEGDDGFVTGDDDELEMANIRVKLHYQGDVRGMTIPLITSFNEFVKRVTTKFETSLTGLRMRFMDEEGTKISLRDESDFELAIETAREIANGRSEGKMEVWCVDV